MGLRNGILIRIRKKHIRIGNKFDCVEGVRLRMLVEIKNEIIIGIMKLLLQVSFHMKIWKEPYNGSFLIPFTISIWIPITMWSLNFHGTVCSALGGAVLLWLPRTRFQPWNHCEQVDLRAPSSTLLLARPAGCPVKTEAQQPIPRYQDRTGCTAALRSRRRYQWAWRWRLLAAIFCLFIARRALNFFAKR